MPSILGYTGEYQDPVTGGYPLGNGYRMYLPELMRFSAPDDLSPFDEGGIHPYVYCGDDPINHSDPSGHFGWFDGLMFALMMAPGAEGIGAAGEAVEEIGAIGARQASASFSPGDLIYGLRKDRLSYVEGNHPVLDIAEADRQDIPYFADHFKTPHEQRTEEIESWQAGTINSAQHHEFLSYLQGATNPKYKGVYEFDLSAIPKNLQEDMEDQMTSRKSKAGLEWMTTERKGRVHFILDNIDMYAVVRKLGEGGSSFTASELRWVYRNRSRPEVQERVQFWRAGIPVPPPWDRSPEARDAWQAYKPKRAWPD